MDGFFGDAAGGGPGVGVLRGGGFGVGDLGYFPGGDGVLRNPENQVIASESVVGMELAAEGRSKL